MWRGGWCLVESGVVGRVCVDERVGVGEGVEWR